MTPKLERLRDWTWLQKDSAERIDVDWSGLPLQSESSRCKRAAICLAAILQAESEHPFIHPDERIVLTRHVRNLPKRYSDEEMAELRKTAYFHEMGVVFNLSPNYGATLAAGLDARREEVLSRRETTLREGDTEGIEFLDAVLSGIDAVCSLAEAYRLKALEEGRGDIAETLAQVPRKPARTFLEALQFLRILHFSLWCEGTYHNGIGRFDQFIWPYLKADLESGRLGRDEALELLEEFFLSFNRDSGLYIGVQQGDNGQSMMLGGIDREGNDAVNPLTYMALEACCEVKLIDPKINLRISAQSPIDLLEKATQLTRLGLGFPQYANDDVVISGLVRLGYDLADARDYTVAACWEFIIPGRGMDIPNIDAVCFPAVVNTVLHSREGQNAKSFEVFLELVHREIHNQADTIAQKLQRVDMLPCPFTSLLCDGRIEKARDAAQGNRYNNFGVHGTGIAPAVDSLAALQKTVFQEHSVTLAEMAAVCDTNFQGRDDLLAEVKYDSPRLGIRDSETENGVLGTKEIAKRLIAWFAESWEGRVNCRGGIWRAGTGSAMYYVRHPNEIPASPDGRLKGEPFPANYAPSLGYPVQGPLSVIEAFTAPDLTRVVNGGPLTIELHDSVFREPESITKVAQMVRYFAKRGGHQLQINTINRDQLLDAQRHPEKWRHLIVRVWGWSGYFVELDRPYQDQIIKRAEMTFPA